MQINELPLKQPSKPRVCSYVRVSTNKEEQEYSFAFQSHYWETRFANDNTVEYIGIFADEGISGAYMKKRKALNNMLEKAYNGEIDIIYTKSVSRFARNKMELMSIVRELRDKGVAIVFESENINTLDPKCNLILTVMSSLAEEELISMSKNQKWACRKRYANGSVELARILGYDYVDGKLVVNDEDAKTVRKIFELYLNGTPIVRICQILNKAGYKTMHGGSWSRSTVLGMLRNEKYCGDSIMQKSYYVMKVKKKNYGELPQYYVENDHEPIISRDDYKKVQQMLQDQADKHSPKANTVIWYPLSGKIKCGECGKSFKRKISAKGTPYECVKWTCRTKDLYSHDTCASHDIKDEVITKLLIEAFNESLDNNGRLSGIAEREAELQRLLNMERDLRQLKARNYISDTKYETEFNNIIYKIKEEENIIREIKGRDIDIKKYRQSDKFTDQMAEFLMQATVKDWTVKFEFKNGYITTKKYTNGRAGNVNGKLCKHKA